MQVSSPGVFNAGLHLHMLQGSDGVLLPCTGFSWNLYSDLPCCFQFPVGRIKIAENETHKQLSLWIPDMFPFLYVGLGDSSMMKKHVTTVPTAYLLL